jgi:IPT/TIG domain
VRKRCGKIHADTKVIVVGVSLVILLTTSAITAQAQVPPPTITALYPNNAPTGSPTLELIVNGSGFTTAYAIQWNNQVNLPTTFVNSSRLTASVPPNLLTATGAVPVRAVNTTISVTVVASNSLTFFIGTAGPRIVSFNPPTAVAGGSTFMLTVNGSGFSNAVPGTVLQWNGTRLVTTVNSSSVLMATVPANLISTVGMSEIAVLVLAIEGSDFTSNLVPYTIAPLIMAPDPPAVNAQEPAFTLTLTGSGFAAGATTVLWNQTPLPPPDSINPTQLRVMVPANLIATPGTVQITVVVRGISSNPVSFTIGPPLGRTAIFEVHLRAADTSPITSATRNFVLEVGITFAVPAAADIQPLQALVIVDITPIPTRQVVVTGNTTLVFAGGADDLHARIPMLRSLHLDVPITFNLNGSLLDVKSIRLALRLKSGEQQTACIAEVRGTGILNDACIYP